MFVLIDHNNEVVAEYATQELAELGAFEYAEAQCQGWGKDSIIDYVESNLFIESLEELHDCAYNKLLSGATMRDIDLAEEYTLEHFKKRRYHDFPRNK